MTNKKETLLEVPLLEVKQEIPLLEVPLFPKEDKEAIEKLRRVAHPTSEEINLIWSLFKRYTGSPLTSFTTNCNSCPSSIVNIYWQLLEWFAKNESQFEQ